MNIGFIKNIDNIYNLGDQVLFFATNFISNYSKRFFNFKRKEFIISKKQDLTPLIFFYF